MFTLTQMVLSRLSQNELCLGSKLVKCLYPNSKVRLQSKEEQQRQQQEKKIMSECGKGGKG